MPHMFIDTSIYDFEASTCFIRLYILIIDIRATLLWLIVDWTQDTNKREILLLDLHLGGKQSSDVLVKSAYVAPPYGNFGAKELFA